MLKKITVLTMVGAICAASAIGATKQVLVVNKGIGGHASADGLKRLQRDVLDVKPDYLILYFGMNDSHNPRRRVAPDIYRKNMQTMIDRAKAGGIKNIILVSINPVNQEILQKRVGKHPAKNDLNGHLKKFDVIVRELAEKNKLPLVDLRALCNKYGGGRDIKKSLVRVNANGGRGDGVHLNAKGYQKFAELFMPVLKGKIKAGDVVVCFGDSITYGAHVRGAGTISGDTYPAWLSLYLNQLVGASKRKRPLPSFKLKGSPKNGDMEYCSDRVRPDFWRIWNVKNRQEGDGRIAMGQGLTGNALKMTNSNSKYPAFLLSLDLSKIRSSKKYTFSFQYKGSGQIRPVIGFYGKRNKSLGAFPKNVKSNPWRKGSDEWKTDSITLEIPDGALKMRACFRITGTILLDNVKFSTSGIVSKNIVRPKAAAELKNKYISIQFRDPKDGGGIISIRNTSGIEFINRSIDGLLWSARLKKIPDNTLKLPKTAALSNDPEQNDEGGQQNDTGSSSDLLKITSINLNVKGIVSRPDKDTIIFKWNGVDIGAEKAVFDVWVKISLLANDKFARFRAGFNNRSSKYTVFYLISPIVQGIYPENGELKEDRLAIPCFTGRLCLNPIENGILGKKERFQQNRSGHSMQFDAYYNKQNGIYLGCFDSDQNVKRYRYKTDKDTGLTWAMIHVPDNMKKVPQIWKTPYDTVVRCFKGDWYDAARIYRKWALKQSWSAEGPLLTRKSTPKWFKEIDEWFLWGVQKNVTLMYTPKLLKAIKGLKSGVFATYWGKGSYFHHRTPDRFPLPPSTIEYIKLAKQHYFRIIAYIQGICWDIETESFKKENGLEHSVKNFYGQSMVWDFSKKKKNPDVCAIAYPGKVWTRVLGDTVEKMARVAKFDVAYLDSDNHGGTYLNFNPLYNKNSGGGNEYIKANQKMIRELRKRARKYNPEFCFTAESFWEGNIGVLDGILACNNWHRYLKKGEAEAIPLAQAVYHDYTIFFSTWLGKRDIENDDSISFIAKFGQALVWGFKPGWNQPANLLTFKNHETALSTSLKRYHAYVAAKKFLVYGEMLREPKVINKLPEINFRYWKAWRNKWFDVAYPAVLRSMWKAADGSFGVVLYNITKEPQKVKIQLTTKELKGVSGVKINSIYPERMQAKTTMQSGYVMISCTVPARSPAVIQINK